MSFARRILSLTLSFLVAVIVRSAPNIKDSSASAFGEWLKDFSHIDKQAIVDASEMLSQEDQDNILRGLMNGLAEFTFGKKNMTCADCVKIENDFSAVMAGFFAAWKPIMAEVCKEVAQTSTLTEDGCNTIVGRYIPVIESSYSRLFIANHGLICQFMMQKCTNESISRVDITPIMEQIYAGQPMPQPKTPTYRKNYTILQINDIHIDFNYYPGGISNCQEGLMCCRVNKTVIVGDDPEYAGYWGSSGSCDLPQQTFEQFLSFAKTLKPDYIYWLGDNENHEVDTITRDVNVNTTKYLATRLATIGSKVYLAIGNHENNPIDTMNFNNPKDNAWFWQNLTSDYQVLLSSDEEKQINQTGYYSSFNSDHNLLVISLYSTPMDSLNFYLLVRTYDTDGQIAWLWNQLKQAEKNNWDVHIIVHIPIGNDFSIGIWDQIFNALVERYQNNIRAIFSAHTHNDHLIFHRTKANNEEVLKTQFVGPSLTTFTNLNPSFRVFTVDQDTNEVIDYTQYRLNLDKYNQIGPSATLAWDVAYTFKAQYNMTDLSAGSMQGLYNVFKRDYSQMGVYIANFYTTAYNSQIPIDPYQAINIRCAMYSNSRDYFRCLGLLAPVAAGNSFVTLMLSNIYPAFMKLKF
jgi:sphingomyelin phosphodiesterase